MSTTAAEMLAEANDKIESVSPKAASDEMASGQTVFLDVREPVEWEQHIEGSVQVPRGLLEFVADPASPKHNPELDPTRRVIVYCRSGTRGALAAYTLKALGFENVAICRAGLPHGRRPVCLPANTPPTYRCGRLARKSGTRLRPAHEVFGIFPARAWRCSAVRGRHSAAALCAS